MTGETHNAVAKGHLSEREYIASTQLARQQMVFIGRCLIGAMFAIGLAWFAVMRDKWGLGLMGGAVGGLLGEHIQSRFFLVPKLRRLFGQLKGIGEVIYTWDDERLFFTYQNGHGSRAWTDFVKARENGELILLYVNDEMWEIIVKRWFTTAADLDDFRRHVRFDT